MTIAISPELEPEEWREQSEEPIEASDPEFAEVLAAVVEGPAQAERGESSPAPEVFTELRAKSGIPRSAGRQLLFERRRHVYQIYFAIFHDVVRWSMFGTERARNFCIDPSPSAR